MIDAPQIAHLDNLVKDFGDRLTKLDAATAHRVAGSLRDFQWIQNQLLMETDETEIKRLTNLRAVTLNTIELEVYADELRDVNQFQRAVLETALSVVVTIASRGVVKMS